MKRLVLLAVVLVGLTCPAGAADPNGHPFRKGQRICFLGDSITHNGQFVAFTQLYFWAVEPELELTFINLGLSSETLTGLTEPNHPYPRPCGLARLTRALREARPDWLFVCYGMNDGLYHPVRLDVLGAYHAGVLEAAHFGDRAGANVILMTPPPFDAETRRARNAQLKPAGARWFGYRTPYENYDDVLEAFRGIVRAFAGRPDVERVIDLHRPLDDYIAGVRRRHGQYLYGDGVHPPTDGHLKFALTILEGLGEDPNTAEQLLTDLTGVALYPPPKGRTPQTPAQRELWGKVVKRHNDLSTAWRGHVGHSLMRKPPRVSLKDALETAAQREQEIRELLKQRAR